MPAVRGQGQRSAACSLCGICGEGAGMMGQVAVLLIVWAVPPSLLPLRPPAVVELRTFDRAPGGQIMAACERWAFDQYPDRLRYRWACVDARASLPLISRPQ